MGNFNNEILTLLGIAIALSAYLSAIRLAGIQKLSDLPERKIKELPLNQIIQLLSEEIDKLSEEEIKKLQIAYVNKLLIGKIKEFTYEFIEKHKTEKIEGQANDQITELSIKIKKCKNILINQINKLPKQKINKGKTETIKENLKNQINKLLTQKSKKLQKIMKKDKRSELKKKLRILMIADVPMIISASSLVIYVLWGRLFCGCPSEWLVTIGLWAFAIGGAAMVLLHVFAWHKSLKGICKNET